MKKETIITLTAGETETYERCLKLLSHIHKSDIKVIESAIGNKPMYKVSCDFMYYVEQIINLVSGEEFNFLD